MARPPVKQTSPIDVGEQGLTPFSEYANLTMNEKVIIEFIAKNPGVTKQAIVNAFYGRMSRATIFGNIGRLSDLDVLQIKKERPNSQIHQVFYNKENLLTSAIDALDRFENPFLIILYKIESVNFEKLSSNEKEGFDILTFHLFSLYMKFVEIYMSKALIIWPQKTLNRNLVNRLHLILFSRLTKIQLTLSNTLPSSYFIFDYAENPSKRPFLHNSLVYMKSALREAKKYAIDNELMDVRFELLSSEEELILNTKQKRQIKDLISMMRADISRLQKTENGK
jgi:hypothetical protein